MHFKCLAKSGGTSQYRAQMAEAFFVAHYCIMYGSDFDPDESTLWDVMRCDVELHVPMPTDVNEQPAAAAGVRRDQLT